MNAEHLTPESADHRLKPGNTLLSLVKPLVVKREFNSLEILFLEFITQADVTNKLNESWECIEYLNRPQIGLSSYAQSLSLLLLDYLIEHNFYKEALDHIRRTKNVYPVDRKLRQKVVSLYKKVYPENKNLDILIHLSQIEESAPFSQAIDTLDKFLGFGKGSPVYSSRFGYGEIIEINFLLDTIKIIFFSSPSGSGEQSFTFEQSLKSLQIIPQDNFFFLKDKKSPLLQKWIKENPQELARIIKRDLPENSKTTEIRKLLKGIVADEAIKSFIEYIRKSKSEGKPKKTKSAAVRPQIDQIEITSLRQDKIIELLNNLPSITKQKFILDLKENRKDYYDLYYNLFFALADKRVLETIFCQFDEKTQTAVLDKIFIEYKNYPVQFLYLADKRIEDPDMILTRYLDLVQSSAIKFKKMSLANEVRKRLIKNNYELVKKAVNKITSDNALRIFTRIEEIKNLYPEERDAIKNIIQQQFPELVEATLDGQAEYIYSTEASISNKQAELHKLVNEEIPKNASEVARARSYGDLRENFEYKAAKEKQKRLFHKISEIRQQLTKVKPIDFTKIDVSKVNIGTTVKVISVNDNQILIFTILGIWDTDIEHGIISYLAPFAQKLLNKKVGDEISDDEGKKYKIIEITKTAQ